MPDTIKQKNQTFNTFQCDDDEMQDDQHGQDPPEKPEVIIEEPRICIGNVVVVCENSEEGQHCDLTGNEDQQSQWEQQVVELVSEKEVAVS